MLDRYFARYFWTFRLSVLVASAFLVARTINAFAEVALTIPPERITAATSRAPGPTPIEGAPLEAFLERNLFRAARRDLVPPGPPEAETSVDPRLPASTDCTPSSSARLLATIVAADPSASLAIFQGPAGHGIVAHRVGEEALDGVEVTAILWRSVVVRREGRCELFSLEEPRAPNPGAEPQRPSPERPASTLGRDVKQTSEGRYDIPRTEVDHVLSNLSHVAAEGQLVPSFQNGKANGFKVLSIRPGSLYANIGLQNGDIVQKINGYEITSPEKAFEIYSKLREAREITVDLIRRGQPRTMTYEIR